MVPGQIVEFIEEGRVICAVCLEERKGRVRCLTESLREVSLSSPRLVHLSEERLPLNQSRESLARHLQGRSAMRQELAKQVQVEELWELLREEGGEYTPRELAELAFGRAGDDQCSAVIRAMLADRLHFKFRVHGFRPNDQETVEKILAQRNREEEKERQIQNGAEWLRAVWAGRQGPPPAEGQEIVEVLKDYALYGKGARSAQAAEEMLRRAGLTHPLAAFNTLVRMGVWSPDENLHLHRHGTRREFPPAALEQAMALKGMASAATGWPGSREDLRDRPIYTIDEPHTKDVDDALGIEPLPGGFRVGIYIADVSGLIPKGSPLDREAASRATSIYLPEERIPMLPSEVSEGLCSLLEGETRAAVGLILDVDHHGRLTGHRFCLCWIRVKRRMSYAEVDEVADDPQWPLGALFRIARAWREERVRNGALLLPLPEVSVKVDEAGQISLERRDRETPSQVLVSEMMIQANRLAARCLKEASIPAIYRAQGEPRERIVEAYGGDLLLNYRQRRLLNRAEFLLEPGLHTGLGVEAYVTVTSPIRRFHDLVMQRQLVAHIRGEAPPYNREELEEILRDSEEILAQAAQMEQARQRYWLLRYLEGRKGLTTQALVLGRYGKKVQILLPEFMLESSLPAASAPWLQEGMGVTVRILRAKAMEDELRVEICPGHS